MNVSMYIYIYVCVSMCIYIYIYLCRRMSRHMFDVYVYV